MNVTKNLFTFDSVIDIDIAIISLMIDEFPDAKKYYKSNIISASLNVLKNYRISSPYKNPLKILFKDEYSEGLEDMYADIIEKYYDSILEISLPNDVFKLSETFMKTDDKFIQCSINCRNSKEKQYINKILDSNYDTKIDVKDVTSYGCIFVKYPEELLQFSNVEGKHIYVSNLRCNYDNDCNISKLLVKNYADTNFIHTVDPYAGMKLNLKPLTNTEE